MNFVLFIIIGVGITNLAVNASIFDYPRDYLIELSNDSNYFRWVSKLITCMMCSGFWVGFLMTLDSSFAIENPVYGGAVISVCSYLFGTTTDYLDLLIAEKGVRLGITEAEEE